MLTSQLWTFFKRDSLLSPGQTTEICKDKKTLWNKTTSKLKLSFPLSKVQYFLHILLIYTIFWNFNNKIIIKFWVFGTGECRLLGTICQSHFFGCRAFKNQRNSFIWEEWFTPSNHVIYLCSRFHFPVIKRIVCNKMKCMKLVRSTSLDSASLKTYESLFEALFFWLLLFFYIWVKITLYKLENDKARR